jgi:chromosome segregation ATPase
MKEVFCSSSAVVILDPPEKNTSVARQPAPEKTTSDRPQKPTSFRQPTPQMSSDAITTTTSTASSGEIGSGNSNKRHHEEMSDDIDIEEHIPDIKRECRSQSPTSTSQPNTYDNENDNNFIDLTVEDEEMANKLKHYREENTRLQRDNDELLMREKKLRENFLREIKKLREDLQEEKAIKHRSEQSEVKKLREELEQQKLKNQSLEAEKEDFRQKYFDKKNRLEKLASEVTNSVESATKSDVKFVNFNEFYNSPRQS